ncbi:thioredoxin family protein [Aerococcaceae bacterium DSM 111020]|nr:thioredoxin family protein [Aerococcaceae bacterium DSM 111020]
MNYKRVFILIVMVMIVGFGFDFSSDTVQIKKDSFQFHENFNFADLTDNNRSEVYRELDAVTQLSGSMPETTTYSQIESFHQFKQLNQLFEESNEMPIVIYFGYDTCPYCKAFVPKINQLAKENDVTIHYYNTDKYLNDPDFNKIVGPFKIKTVPHAFLIEEKEIIEVVNEKSRMEEIEVFIKQAKPEEK